MLIMRPHRQLVVGLVSCEHLALVEMLKARCILLSLTMKHLVAAEALSDPLILTLLSVGTELIPFLLQHPSAFSKDEIEQAEGASTVPNEVDPVEYEVLRRVTENEEQLPEETVLDFITATPHQHPYRYSYEESSVLLRHQAEIEFARESVEFEREENEEEAEPIEEETTDDVVSSRRFRRHSSDFFNRWHAQASNEPLLSRIHSQDSHERKPTTYNSSNKQQRFTSPKKTCLFLLLDTPVPNGVLIYII